MRAWRRTSCSKNSACRSSCPLVDRTRDAHKSPEYLQLNPNGLIPVLVHDELVLYETAAICLHLVDMHPQTGLAPALGTAERAHFYKWLVWLTNTLQAGLLLYFYPERWVTPGHAQGATGVKARAEARIGPMLEQLDQELARHGGPWLLGERYSAIDPYALMLCRWTRNFLAAGARSAQPGRLPAARARTTGGPARVADREAGRALGLRRHHGAPAAAAIIAQPRGAASIQGEHDGLEFLARRRVRVAVSGGHGDARGLCPACAAAGAAGADYGAGLQRRAAVPPMAVTSRCKFLCKAFVNLGIIDLDTRKLISRIALPGADIRSARWVGNERLIFSMARYGEVGARAQQRRWALRGEPRWQGAAQAVPDRGRMVCQRCPALCLLHAAAGGARQRRSHHPEQRRRPR